MGRMTLTEVQDHTTTTLRSEEVHLDRGTVLCRGFTKARANHMRESCMVDGELKIDKMEIYLFKYGVVDPDLSSLSDDDILVVFDQWSSVDVEKVLKVMNNLNGYGEDNHREQVTRFRPE